MGVGREMRFQLNYKSLGEHQTRSVPANQVPNISGVWSVCECILFLARIMSATVETSYYITTLLDMRKLLLSVTVTIYIPAALVGIASCAALPEA
jgi:hypothetical protein